MKAWVFEALGLVLFMFLGGAAIIAAGNIRQVAFDPLGSSATPYAVGSLILLLSLICVARMVRKVGNLPRTVEEVEESSSETTTETVVSGTENRDCTRRELIEVAAIFVLVLAYIYAIFDLGIPFSIMTIALIVIGASVIEQGFKTKTLFVAACTGAFIGFGGELLFTKVFFVDLPTIW